MHSEVAASLGFPNPMQRSLTAGRMQGAPKAEVAMQMQMQMMQCMMQGGMRPQQGMQAPACNICYMGGATRAWQ